ncbi:hypothetical protein V8E53_000893 [Lactarius tabidus]
MFLCPGELTASRPKILRDVDRKACQILIDTLDPKIQGASNTEIKEKTPPSWRSANFEKQDSQSCSRRRR